MPKMPGKIPNMLTDRALTDEEIAEMDQLESMDMSTMTKEQMSRYRELQYKLELAGEHDR